MCDEDWYSPNHPNPHPNNKNNNDWTSPNHYKANIPWTAKRKLFQESKMKQIEDYLEKYQDLWWNLEEPPLPIFDISMSIIQDEDYGCDFKGDQRVMMFSFTGDSCYFPAFWIGDSKNYEENLDEFPIFVFDIENDDEPVTYAGNFKNYISTILEAYPHNEAALEALKDLRCFSESVLYNGMYNLKTVN